MQSKLKHLLWLCAILSLMLIPFFSSLMANIIHFAQYRREHAFLTGIFISKVRVKMLEKRIIHVLYS
ncbi:MAG: hypothetical protein AMS17_08305 [Spirochaetes bacterium DG_61]|nr:MAG: hypothetical protein AMS17_08305 [Spirochaetes bacterium DG_61]